MADTSPLRSEAQLNYANFGSAVGRDVMMTAVPLAMLVAFAMFMAGGPAASLAWLEGVLRSMFEWVSKLV